MGAKLTAPAERLAREPASQAGTTDELDGLFRGLMTSARQRRPGTAVDIHRGRTGAPAPPDPPAEAPPPAAPRNRRNGYPRKAAPGEPGEARLDTPRDRGGTFEPQLIGRYRRRPAGCDGKALALYAKGLATRDLPDVAQGPYGVEVSATRIPEVTADLGGGVSIWRPRRPDAVWPTAYLDGIAAHVRGAGGGVSRHTTGVALGVNPQGREGLMGLRLAQGGGAEFWPSCLTGLKGRGLRDSFVARADGPTGFPAAPRAADPQAEVQPCVAQLARAALKSASDKGSREVVRDLKAIYQAAAAAGAGQALGRFADKGGGKYPATGKRWRPRRAGVVAPFALPPAIRTAVDTTNAIGSVSSAIRRFTRNRKQSPGAGSAVKLICRAMAAASRTWAMPSVGWKQALNHCAIRFEGRLPLNLAE